MSDSDRSAQNREAAVKAILDSKVDWGSFTKFPVVGPAGGYKKDRVDIRQELKVDPKVDLPDYSGQFKPDLRYTDFSREQLVAMLAMNGEYRRVWIGAWLEEIANRFGRDESLEIEWLAWRDNVVPKLANMLREFLPASLLDARLEAADLGRFVGDRPAGGDNGIDYAGPFAPDPSLAELSKEELVTMVLGSAEYMLECFQGISMHVVIRHGLEAMFGISWDIWSAKVLPAIKDIKARHMGITGNDVAAFMKDLQIDGSAMPGKMFDLDFEMPEPDVGIMTFNRCCAPERWEPLGRPDILEKFCHACCPASIIETAKIYNPNMKTEILAIPPRVDSEHVCCRWKLSMRTPDDPEYVQVGTEDERD